MATRALRQYYDEPVPLEVDDDLGSVVEPWLRHRRRLVEELSALSDEQWAGASRCAGWDGRDVVCHLITADSFWVASLQSGAEGAPSSYLDGFDPAGTPAAIVTTMSSLSSADVLDQFAAGTDTFVDTVTAIDGGGSWAALAESPLGQVPARLVLAHALWDSWLHERDILLPLGIEVPIEADELTICAWYLLAFGAVQGGLVDDPAPVGPGLTDPLDVTLAFADLPEWPLRLVVDRGVRAERGGTHTAPIGSAVDLVETYTGRATDRRLELPPALDAHLLRALQIL